MSDINKRVSDWNRDIQEFEKLRDNARRDALKRKDGIGRRVFLWVARFADKWAQRGKKWRNEDMRDA